jgi:hypothetical protein
LENLHPLKNLSRKGNIHGLSSLLSEPERISERSGGWSRRVGPWLFLDPTERGHGANHRKLFGKGSDGNPLEFGCRRICQGQAEFSKKLLEKEGREKFQEQAKKIYHAAGHKGLVDRLGLTGNDAKSAAVIIPTVIAIWYGSNTKFEIEEATAEKARVRCTNCAFWNYVQVQKITEDICSAKSRYYWESFAKAINPKLTSTFVKARPLGDPVCEWVFELKT